MSKTQDFESSKLHNPEVKLEKEVDLECNGTSESIKVLDELAHPDVIPGVPVLLTKHVIRGEVVEDGGSALGGGFGKRGAIGFFQSGGSGFPESVYGRGMEQPRPQTNGFAVRRARIDKNRS